MAGRVPAITSLTGHSEALFLERARHGKKIETARQGGQQGCAGKWARREGQDVESQGKVRAEADEDRREEAPESGCREAPNQRAAHEKSSTKGREARSRAGRRSPAAGYRVDAGATSSGHKDSGAEACRSQGRPANHKSGTNGRRKLGQAAILHHHGDLLSQRRAAYRPRL